MAMAGVGGEGGCGVGDQSEKLKSQILCYSFPQIQAGLLPFHQYCGVRLCILCIFYFVFFFLQLEAVSGQIVLLHFVPQAFANVCL